MAAQCDTFVEVGSAFDIPEEDVPRKKALHIHEQIATDKEGRRRFHGAFTGGFSAGYFNTVGSKEGWTPSTFISSRSQRSGSARQRPEDFMDEDDLDEFGIAPRNVETTKKFSQEKPVCQKRKDTTILEEHDVSLNQMIRFALEDVVIACRNSIGVKLLKKMGWKEGQGIGQRVRQVPQKKVYGCSLPSKQQTSDDEQENDIHAEGLLFAPKDTKPLVFVPKDNMHGIGYQGLSAPSILSNTTSKPGYAGNLKIKGQAFGVGAFEDEDDDVYVQDSMSNYDIELSEQKPKELHGWTGPPSHDDDKGGKLSNFAKASKPREANKMFRPPIIPKGYQPFSTLDKKPDDEPNPSKNTIQVKQHLTSDDRATLLGEESATKSKSVFDFISPVDKNRIPSNLNKNTVKRRPPLLIGSKGFQPFAKDPVKQARYDHFLECRKTGKDMNFPEEMCVGLTEWEREREKEEFTRSAMLFQPLKGSIASRFIIGGNIDDEGSETYKKHPENKVKSVAEEAAAMKMFGTMTRESFQWHPAKLLCKRFNIPEPYPSSKAVGLTDKRQTEKFNMGNLFKPTQQQPVKQRQDNPVTNTTESLDTSETNKNGAMIHPVETPTSMKIANDIVKQERPSMDLFKSIFADSSEESEVSDSEDDTPENTTTSVPSTTDTVGITTTRNSAPMTTTNTVLMPVTSYPRSQDTAAVITPSDINPSLSPQSERQDKPLDVFGPTPPPKAPLATNNKQLSNNQNTSQIPFSEAFLDVSQKSKKSKKHKTKHKRKHKAKDQEKEKTRHGDAIDKNSKNRSQSHEQVPSDKEILSKLKNFQKKRMCAADFM